MNKYCYEIIGGKCKGYFKIYQAKNGSIQLMMGNCTTTLSLQQVLDLNIYTFDLIDYNHKNFLEFYLDFYKAGDSNVED